MSGVRVAIVVQARTSSTRLPGKVLKPLAGAPAIVRMMERVARVERAQAYVVATSVEASDDALAETCRAAGIPVARGPLDDVLSRFVRAVPEDCDTVVRLTGDCPLVDPALVDLHIETFVAKQPEVDYVTNAVVRTQPDGLDVEVVSRELLERADREATDPHDREHVLTWVRERAQMEVVTQSVDLSALRWTLDTSEDYEVISQIYQALHPANPDFDSTAIYRLLLERPELILVEGEQGDTAHWIARIREHLA